MDDPKSILDPEWIDITLCGRVYQWKMPSARGVREWASCLAHIESALMNDETQLFAAINSMLDFFYANNKLMAKDRGILDNAATAEVLKAKKEISEFIAPPLLRLNEGLAELAEEIQAAQKSSDAK